MNNGWSHQEIVEALYQGLLNRESDASGLEAHTNFLSEQGDIKSLVHLIKSFLTSEEFKGQLNKPLFSPIRHAMISTPKIQSEKINHVMSVGAACFTSSILDRWWLRNFSGPFDWMFSSMSMVHHVLWDDFRTFLDISQMVPICDTSGRTVAVNHPFYVPYAQFPRGHESAPLFLHHDAINKDRAHFGRAVDRMRQALSRSTLLVGIYQDLPGHEDEFVQFAEFLSLVFPNCRLLAFVVRPSSSTLMPMMAKSVQSGNHTLNIIDAIGDLSEFGFGNFYDELLVLRLLNQYEFDLRPMQ